MHHIYVPEITDHSRLLSIWEDSVRATHHFVSEEKRQVLKELIQQQRLFEQSDVFCVRDEKGEIGGFAGVTGDTLDMIFLHPDIIGTGVGKALMLHALDIKKVKRVDVNEQNPHAINFYQRFGFTVYDRSETDDNGQPFPILHMRLTSDKSDL